MQRNKKRDLLNLHKILRQFIGIEGPYESLTATRCSVLTTRDDWTVVPRFPDICKAIEYLTENMKEECPDLDKSLRIGVSFEVKDDE